MRGRPPKSPVLHLVQGTHRTDRHGSVRQAQKAAAASRKTFGPLPENPPRGLTGEARLAWLRWIVPATWLDRSREAAAIAFCELWKEFRFNPPGFPVAKHTSLRGYRRDLGLTDETRRPPAGDAVAPFDDIWA